MGARIGIRPATMTTATKITRRRGLPLATEITAPIQGRGTGATVEEGIMGTVMR